MKFCNYFKTFSTTRFCITILPDHGVKHFLYLKLITMLSLNISNILFFRDLFSFSRLDTLFELKNNNTEF